MTMVTGFGRPYYAHPNFTQAAFGNAKIVNGKQVTDKSLEIIQKGGRITSTTTARNGKTVIKYEPKSGKKA